MGADGSGLIGASFLMRCTSRKDESEWIADVGMIAGMSVILTKRMMPNAEIIDLRRKSVRKLKMKMAGVTTPLPVKGRGNRYPAGIILIWPRINTMIHGLYVFSTSLACRPEAGPVQSTVF